MQGTGTADDPYQISSAAELYWFAAYVNEDNTDACAVLTKDIDLGGEDEPWTPIGINSYTGTFDGRGHTISGLYYEGSGDTGTATNVVGKRADAFTSGEVAWLLNQGADRRRPVAAEHWYGHLPRPRQHA